MNLSFPKSILVTFSGFGVLVLSNVVFNIFSARFLGPVSYGEFNSFFYFLLAFSQPNNSLQLAVAKSVSKNYKIQNLITTIFFLGFFIFFLLLFFFPFILKMYSLSQYRFSFFGALIVLLWLLCAGLRGIYQGRMSFFAYGMNIGLEGVFRVIFFILLFCFGLKVEGAVLSSVFAGFVAMLILLVGLMKDIRLNFKKIDFLLIKETLKAFSILLPFGILFQIDLTLSQYFLYPLDIGYLSACSLYGKNLIILSMVFANVVFSFVVKKDTVYFFWGNILTGIIFLLAYFFTFFWGKWVIFFIQGIQYIKASDFLPLYILYSFPIGIMQQIVNYSFAKDIKSTTFIVWFFLLMAFTLPFLIFSGRIPVNTFLVFLLIFFVVADVFIILFILLYNKKTLLTETKK